MRGGRIEMREGEWGKRSEMHYAPAQNSYVARDHWIYQKSTNLINFGKIKIFYKGPETQFSAKSWDLSPVQQMNKQQPNKS